MTVTARRWLGVASVAVALAGGQLIPAPAAAEPDPAAPTLEGATQPPPGTLRNIIYRARIDGVARGAKITYADEAGERQADPMMVPGRVFEVYAVLPPTQQATMRVAIEWPYSANLHCEILVDDAVVAQADDFIAPRVTPMRDDPDYGAITCAAPVGGVLDPAPAEPAVPEAAA
ncbi:hypothetical protein LV457_14365 [Mycobacterium sp. MYCO198283]|uniref:hypothetical protein n=1 Tax=Mycobacterium sp. MYCO198283 TaxID=2883505 RepID=UPI001E2B9919|nr:hypothetical protein [Mycobacterium sp. MYCO198283]MCG5433463.1 hypothetical protein [Mycobacterium sp. MYCO198283]